jgi:thiol-disulfide isomerase/thioredoxin
MGDGTIKKYAIVINGDGSDRHLENVELSRNLLGGQGYDVYVASPEQSEGLDSSHYVQPTSENIRQLIENLKQNVDDDDEVVIYTTGHGREEGFCLGLSCETADLIQELDTIPFGERTVVMDQCYGGNWKGIFTDDPRTLFISTGFHGEAVCCQQFAPYFWSPDLSDLSQGFIDWRARFENAASHDVDSTPLFMLSPGYISEGEAPFTPEVVHLEGEGEAALNQLHDKISSLRPGQYAIVDFSLPGCQACQEYISVFSSIAEEGGGQYLFIRSTDQDVAESYGIVSYPSVVVFDGMGNRYDVIDRDNILAEISQFNLTPEDLLAMYWSRVDSSDVNMRLGAMSAIVNLDENLSQSRLDEFTAAVYEYFSDDDADVRNLACSTIFNFIMDVVQKMIPINQDDSRSEAQDELLTQRKKWVADQLKALLDMFDDLDFHVRVTAQETLRSLTMLMAYNVGVGVLGRVEDTFNDSYLDVFMEANWTFIKIARDVLPNVLDAYERLPGMVQEVDDVEAGPVLRAISDDFAARVNRTLADLFRDSESPPDISSFNAFERVLTGFAAGATISRSGMAEKLGRLRRLFTHPDENVRHLALAFYSVYANLVPEDAIRGELRALRREIWELHDTDLRRSSVSNFGDLAEMLDVRRISRAMEHVNGDGLPRFIRGTALAAYAVLFARAPDAVKRDEEVILQRLLTDESEDDAVRAAALILCRLFEIDRPHEIFLPNF